MELIRGLHNLRPRHRGCVATIGAFDGVHRGHCEVLSRLIAKGRELGLPSTVVIFEPLPREYFAPQQAPARLMSFREKFLALREQGVDRVLRVRFTDELREMSAPDFVRKVFVDGLGARYLIVGDDLRFGRNREGNYQLLRQMAAEHGFAVSDIDTQLCDRQRISSTRIREALEQSDFALAESLLGRPYSISGRVVVGKQLGRQLNAPTANLQLRRLRTAMAGVYAVEVISPDARRYHGVANVGTRPTVGDLLEAMLEVHILDFDRNIYGKNIEVVFRKKLRDEKKFASLEELKRQIQTDFEQGRAYFGLASVDANPTTKQ